MGHIYWIASYPKSGNTWMRSFLARLILGEQGSINDLGGFAPDENLGTFYQPFLAGPIADASREEQAEVRPRVQAAIASAVQGFQFLKTHSMLARHAGTPTINTAVTAGAIYLVRNPLDVVVSYSAFRNYDIDDTIGRLNEPGRLLSRNYKHAYVPCGSWSEHVTSWTRRKHDRLLVLRYEDMLTSKDVQFGRVVGFLGLQVEADALREAVAATSFDNLRAEEETRGFSERPGETGRFFRRGEAEQWRTELTESQVAAIVLPNREAMTALGYWEAEFADL